MITYNDIYEATRKERYSENLQPLPKNFVTEVSQYLEDKKQVALKQDDAFFDVIMKTKKQLENAITLFKELMRRRRKKILNLILIAAETGISKQDFDNMLEIEKKLFEELMKSIDISDKKLNNLLSGRESEEKKHEFVCFLDDVAEFVGVDGEKMGPFVKGQMANLPKQIASILVEGGQVEVVED